MAIDRVIRDWPFRAMLARLTFAAAVSVALLAQDPPQQAVPQQAIPQQAVTEQSTPPTPVFAYEGKPITLPYQCSLEDIRWAGLTCSEDEPCPIYLELSSVDAVGERVFAAGNIHSDAVTLYSVLLSSADGGHSWQVGPDSVRGWARPDSVPRRSHRLDRRPDPVSHPARPFLPADLRWRKVMADEAGFHRQPLRIHPAIRLRFEERR